MYCVSKHSSFPYLFNMEFYGDGCLVRICRREGKNRRMLMEMLSIVKKRTGYFVKFFIAIWLLSSMLVKKHRTPHSATKWFMELQCYLKIIFFSWEFFLKHDVKIKPLPPPPIFQNLRKIFL